jgi:phosphate:Na+ symporter
LLVAQLIPSRVYRPRPILQAKYLEKKFIPFPSIALNQSWKEIRRITIYLVEMMGNIGRLIEHDEPGLVRQVKRREKYVDSLVRQSVSYLVQVSQGTVPDLQSKQLVDQLFILDNLESISDSLKRMGSQSAKRIDAGITFSGEGTRELMEVHSRVAALLRRLDKALKDEDWISMREISEASNAIEKSDEKLKLSHFQRLMSGKPESESSTTIHMELLNQLAQINSHIGIIARRMAAAVSLEEFMFDEYTYDVDEG